MRLGKDKEFQPSETEARTEVRGVYREQQPQQKTGGPTQKIDPEFTYGSPVSQDYKYPFEP